MSSDTPGRLTPQGMITWGVMFFGGFFIDLSGYDTVLRGDWLAGVSFHSLGEIDLPKYYNLGRLTCWGIMYTPGRLTSDAGYHTPGRFKL